MDRQWQLLAELKPFTEQAFDREVMQDVVWEVYLGIWYSGKCQPDIALIAEQSLERACARSGLRCTKKGAIEAVIAFFRGSVPASVRASGRSCDCRYPPKPWYVNTWDHLGYVYPIGTVHST